MMIRILYQLLLGFGLLLLVNVKAHGQLVPGEHVDAQLISETESAATGQDFWIALHLSHHETWHTYWKNPGDAGKPTEIIWNLPEGVTASEIVWPTPMKIEWPSAGLVDFGYENEIFLLTKLSLADDFQAESVNLSAQVNWLECSDTTCIPNGANLSLIVPINEPESVTVDEQWRSGFAQTRASFPREDIVLDSMFSINDGEINLLVQATESIFENAQSISFIPGEHRVFDYTAEQNITSQLSSLQLSQSHHQRVLRGLPDRIGGLLLVTSNQGLQTAYEIQAELEGVDFAILNGVQPAADNELNVGLVFGLAMLAGIILNLMPCVFPVLSLKVLSLVSSGAASPREQRLQGLTYTAGVIVSFLILASIFLILQAGGAVIGWGFHMQSPWFVASLVYLFFVMALSMTGVVDFGTGIMGVGSELADKEGYWGSFFTGVLASVVASPCMAPFMGAAVGFAFTQSTPIALTVFISLGLGMALPFLLLSFIPALGNIMPKPGKWMLTFKKLLALPLYATAIWLLWVLSLQTSLKAVVSVLGACLLLGFAAWLYQNRRLKTEYLAYKNIVMIGLCLIIAFGILPSPLLKSSINEEGLNAQENGYEVYSDARLAELREAGTPVFVNMTAAWCITCLVNERVALVSDEFQASMKEKSVTYLKGDWTNNNPEITEVLKRYQTSGVPLYLMFPADNSLPAEVLPQILTESIMLDALTRI